jgi:hypothetical protein
LGIIDRQLDRYNWWAKVVFVLYLFAKIRRLYEAQVNKIFMYKFFAVAILILLVTIISVVLKVDTEVDGIKIPQDLYGMMNAVEKPKYEQLVKNSLNGNLNDLRDLINFSCGGGSRCYVHGEILAKIADRIGEEKFIKILPNMTIEDRVYLKFLLSAGLEYGEFDGDKSYLVIEKRFPKLSKSLAN